MSQNNFSIQEITENNRDVVRQIISKWLTNFIITRGRKVHPAEMPGFLAVNSKNESIGLATYEIINDQCELVTLDAFDQFKGIGTRLTNEVILAAKKAGCNRLWLITTNDNIEAIRFYQRRGFKLCNIHVNALESSRKLKPVIPEIGNFGIPMRDELEFEMLLTS